MTTLHATHAWVNDRWQHDVRFEFDRDGRIAAATPQIARDGRDRGETWLVPGIPNLHSHAFQRAMAGLTERQTRPEDSFWTWRELMYAFAAKLTPETLHDIAAMLYVEMLEAGYTSVCEFHYLHHAPDGRPYAEPSAMSQALIAAAEETGIGLTLLPTLYMTGGFDGRALNERQRRFGLGVDEYLALVASLRSREHARLKIGLCFHSLRAVPEAAMRAVLEAQTSHSQPIHIHIAEQIGEVQDCLALRNARPVEWLLANLPVDAHWTLVHATHLVEDEVRALAASRATVAICTTTEANLGDGLFPLRAWIDAGGRFGVGSDSHISTSPIEELRWLEYGQRLIAKRRNIATDVRHSSTGECLYAHALAGGASGTMQAVGTLDAAAAPRADVLVLDAEAPALAGATPDDVIDRWIFSGNRNLVREVYVAGERVVEAGRHRARDAIQARYRRALATLLD
jgi:formimidoylglutamate deiminase